MKNQSNYAKQLQVLLESNEVKKPIVFIGTAGSGKSTVGRRVAKQIKLHFYDSDQIIEERENMSVVEIHGIYGPEYFKKREIEVVEEIISSYGMFILSTGSNAFMSPEVRSLITSHCVSVWLYADQAVLAERISRRNTRPGFTPENTEAILDTIIKEQYPIYRTADIAIESHAHNIYKVVDEVMLKLSEYFNDQLFGMK